jgi:hypothetical protein
MKKILIVPAIFISSSQSFSQDFKKNEVFIELLGNGLWDQLITKGSWVINLVLELELGLGCMVPTHMTIPVGVNYLIRLRNDYSFLDLGLGATFTKTDGFFYAITKLSDGYIRKKDYVYLIPSVGARAYTTKNFVARINLTPFITETGILPSFGLGFGKRF